MKEIISPPWFHGYRRLYWKIKVKEMIDAMLMDKLIVMI